MVRLVRLLGNLFPCRAGGGDLAERVYPYHKSVLDWLTSSEGMDAGAYRVDAMAGHQLLAAACQRVVLGPRATTTIHQDAGQAGLDAPIPSPLRAYALRYAVEHTCLQLATACGGGRGSGSSSMGSLVVGGSSVGGLATLLMDFEFWGAVYSAGEGGARAADE